MWLDAPEGQGGESPNRWFVPTKDGEAPASLGVCRVLFACWPPRAKLAVTTRLAPTGATKGPHGQEVSEESHHQPLPGRHTWWFTDSDVVKCRLPFGLRHGAANLRRPRGPRPAVSRTNPRHGLFVG